MSLSQFHCTSRLYLDMHGLIFETSICYWQDQPGRRPVVRLRAHRPAPASEGLPRRGARRRALGGGAAAPGSLRARRALRPVRPPGARAATVGHLCLTLYPSRKDLTSGGCPAPLRSCSFVSPGRDGATARRVRENELPGGAQSRTLTSGVSSHCVDGGRPAWVLRAARVRTAG